MPRLNGLALAQALLEERPGVRVLYMSGYMEKSMMLGKHPESILLQKPFTPETLITALRRIFASEDQT
jgi:YesN/AraC family two-component response regulator